MASAVKEDAFWNSWEDKVKNDHVGVTKRTLIVQQQKNYALTTQCSRARTEVCRSQ